jgi:hypothetical protein
MKLDLGSHVRASDGRDVGKVDRIILETERMTIREFVVHKGLIFSHDRFVAISYVHHVDDDGVVHLNIDSRQANKLPEFIHEAHLPIVTGSISSGPSVHIITQPGSVPGDAVVLSHRTQVYDDDGKYIGYLDKVEYSSEGQASHIILEAGYVFLHEIRVPIGMIDHIRHDRITLCESLPETEEPVVPLV